MVVPTDQLYPREFKILEKIEQYLSVISNNYCSHPETHLVNITCKTLPTVCTGSQLRHCGWVETGLSSHQGHKENLALSSACQAHNIFFFLISNWEQLINDGLARHQD